MEWTPSQESSWKEEMTFFDTIFQQITALDGWNDGLQRIKYFRLEKIQRSFLHGREPWFGS